MSASPAIRTLSDVRDVIAGYRLPRVILTALEMNLFTTVGTKSWTVPDLSKAMGVSERGLDIVCRVLASAGLLVKIKNQYRNSRLGATELNATSPSYRGAYLDLLRNGWNHWSHLSDSVRSGKEIDDEAPPDDPVYRRQFTWAMHQRSIDAAADVARQVPMKRASTLLDLGGGPGTYAMAFLERNPGLTATVCDRGPALDVAREIATLRKCGGRLSYLPLNFMQEAVPGHFDVVWYSNVLHIYSPEENQALFRRLRSCLVHGGRLIVHDAFLLDRLGLKPLEVNLFAVTMLLCTEHGNTYSLSAVVQWLRDAGFRRVRRLTLKAGTGDWEGGLLEASCPR